MKSALIVAALLLPLPLFAQDSAQKKNELGLFAESNSMDSYDGGPVMSTLGLTYKHHKNDFVALVLSAGHTTYQFAPHSYVHPADFKDTLTWRDLHTNVSLLTIGTAVEVQRKFYKRLSLFAGGELRLSFGEGRSDTMNMSLYRVPYPSTYPGSPGYYIDGTVNSQAGADLSVMQVGILPYIGIKVALGRINLGYSISNYMFRFQSEVSDRNATTYMNFELGNTYQRLFATYRF